MKTLPAGMQDDLDGGVTFYVYLYKVTRRDKTVLGFTNHDEDITLDGVLYEADGGFTPSQFQQTTGLNVDGIEAFGFLQSDRIKEADIFAGKYDDAEIVVERVNWKDTTKRSVVFKGNVGNVQRGRIAFVAEVRSLAHRLNQPTGRKFLYTCDTKLFSPRCAVSKLGTSPLGFAYSFSGVAVTGVGNRRVFSIAAASVSNTPQNWFGRGWIKWQSGNNNTFEADVKQDYPQGTDIVVELWEPMPFDIQVSDTLELNAGCDKTIETCKSKFDNVINHQGFARMPNQDHVLAFARKEGKNDGSSLFT